MNLHRKCNIGPMQLPPRSLFVRFAVALSLLTTVLALPSLMSPAAATPGFSISRSGSSLINASGAPVTLVGVNKSGSEYACQQGYGPFVGPTDQASIDLLKSWNINFVRVPLNEHCWLGTSGENGALSGMGYRAAIADYVNRLTNNGIYVAVDLHFSSPYGANATQDQVMANANYSIPFWTSVANTFKANGAVMFELYNEPHDISAADPWACWRNGCFANGFQIAGMQQLVNAVRDTGSTNVVIIDGLDWGHDMRQYLSYLPTDSANQTAAGQHLYNFKRCVSVSCWNQEFLPVANVMPLVAPEIGQGQNDCSSNGIVVQFMKWMDANGGDGYGVWFFGTFGGGCTDGNYYGGAALLTNETTGATTTFGAGVKQYFLSLPSTATTPTIPPTTPPTTTAPPTTAPPTTNPGTTTTTTPGTPATTTTTRPGQTTTTTTPGNTPNDIPANGPLSGYRVVSKAGKVTGFGQQAATFGDSSTPDVVAIANTPDDRGYWTVSSDGRVTARGNAVFYGDLTGAALNAPIVGIAPLPDGSGYWLLGRDGGVFSYGAARFYGSTGNLKLNAPVVGITSTASGKGYWAVASDGGVFSYGDAVFRGSTGNLKLNQPVVGMAASPSGTGYWLVASDGGVFSFGVPFFGSTGAIKLNAPIIGMVADSSGNGYQFVASDGGVFNFNVPFQGSLASTGTPSPVSGISA